MSTGSWARAAIALTSLAATTMAVPQVPQRLSGEWQVSVDDGFDASLDLSALQQTLADAIHTEPTAIEIVVTQRRHLQAAAGTQISIQYTVSCGTTCNAVQDSMNALTGSSALGLAHAQALIEAINMVGAANGVPNTVLTTAADLAATLTAPTMVTITIPAPAPAPTPVGVEVAVDWVIPSGDSLPAVSANIGDTVVFSWSGSHNVYWHPTGTCDEAGAVQVDSGSSPATWTATEAGTFTFACDVGDHCEWGQVVTVTVAGSTPAPAPGACATASDAYVTPAVTSVGTSASGTTYQLSVTLGGGAYNLHSIYGTAESSMVLPAAYQNANGVGIGGIAAEFVTAMPDLAYDSWVTVGEVSGTSGVIATTITAAEWDSWGVSSGLTTTSGAVMYADPSAGPTAGAAIVVAQLTVSTGSPAIAIMNLGGHTQDRSTTVSIDAATADWASTGVTFWLP